MSMRHYPTPARYAITCKTGEYFSNLPLPDQRPFVPDVSNDGGYFFFKEVDAKKICDLLNEEYPGGKWKVEEL